ncbi:MAG: sigma-54-dependent Fis family transcriptional regulator [Ignavibacteriaceae bacterium]|nr:sigma-54-dependent Fis family transcriptional regulator [Ignavibacteriaceae bacterium]
MQYNEIYRIGSSKPIKLDIRIITATNKDLLEAVNKKEFRADLYYRLNRGYIHLPPLRSRGEDIILLANHFLKVGQKIYNKSIPGFSKEIAKRLKNYEFPGNIRELENIILHTVAQSTNDKPITEMILPGSSMNNNLHNSNGEDFPTIEELVQTHIIRAIQQSKGNTQKAAYILGISERTLQRRLKKLRN